MSATLVDGRGRFRFCGARVREARAEAGLSATALHALIVASGYEISYPGLTRIERGGGTTSATACAIADALGRPVRDFVPPVVS
jgi:transcriptional regulator with XRE-family HTH domain